jgi:response regulator RpfG family c-di-GMP phosphodiesterase
MKIVESTPNVETPRVLVVDDEKVIREILADFLSLEGFHVATAQDGIGALEELAQSQFDMVISDLKMPNMGGLELLEAIKKEHETVLTVIMTGFGTVETAIEAMKKGAYDYILKPFKVEEVVHIVHRGLEKQRLISENIRLREIISLHEFSEQLQTTLSFEEVLESTLSSCVTSAGGHLIRLCLLNDETEAWEESGKIVHPDAPPGVESGLVDYKTIIDELKVSRSIIVHAPLALSFFEDPPPNLTSFMCIPLIIRQKNIGFLFFYSYTSDAKFTEGQRKLFTMLGSRAAAAIDNARLFKKMQQTFRQTIQGLARAIEAMDKYTAGHSDRVTVYARVTAEALNETPDRVELITQAAMLHDIGKLGCHANLNKLEKLTEEEYEIFKEHPGFGKDIISPISFLRPIIPGVHLHHERWDGKGYPCKLAGDAIPKMARILAVADAYDAMTSNRAYRSALKHSFAINELQRCSGSQFDPQIVDAFLGTIDKHRENCERLGISYPS